MLAPSPERNILQRMNYISDQKGILRRFFREAGGWNEHLNLSGAFIQGILQSNEVNQVVVLGSGWLLDFPLEKIIPLVEKITLVDVLFPIQIQRKVRNIKKVECIAADITGGFIQLVYEQLKQGRPKFTIPRDIPVPHISPEKGKLILSLNILNQLDILLVDYIRKNKIKDEELILKLRKLLQESHISMLQEHPYILITDFREILINTHGKVLEERELIFTQLPEGDLMKEWEWRFDTHRLYNAHADTLMKVRAVFSKGR
jgi:hypothetical protein